MKPPISRPRSKVRSVAKATRQFILGLATGLIVDEFACGGGMSEAIEQAFGRHVDVSVNHDDDACSMHQGNHPQTTHFCADVFGREVSPKVIRPGEPIDLLHLSPDCTDHSQAKGGQPRSIKRRGLSWIGVRWAAARRPKIITLENVKEILRWGALIAKRDSATGRVVKIDGTVAAKGERVPLREQYLIPDPKRVGQTWKRFVGALEALGYTVDWWTLNAADFGTPTTRTRLFMVATCDGIAPKRPEPTHFKDPKPGQQRWRSAAECIDWSIPSRSIFGRDRPLAEATMARIARGMWKFVLGPDAQPFIVNNLSNNVPRAANDPMAPILTGGHKALVTPYVVKMKGESPGTGASAPLDTVTAQGHGMAIASPVIVPVTHSDRRVHDAGQPLPVITTAKGGEFAVASAFMMQANGGFNDERGTPGHDLRRPASTISTKGAGQQLVLAHLLQLRNNCDARAANDPLATVSAGGEHHGVVEYRLSKEHEEGALQCAAFLMRYHGEGGQLTSLDDPATTLTTKDRLALVTVWYRGEPWVIVDIQLRMLTPRELFNAQGFPPDYIIDRGHDGRVFSKAQQVWFCGNSVPPPLGRAVIEAQLNARPEMRLAA